MAPSRTSSSGRRMQQPIRNGGAPGRRSASILFGIGSIALLALLALLHQNHESHFSNTVKQEVTTSGDLNEEPTTTDVEQGTTYGKYPPHPPTRTEEHSSTGNEAGSDGLKEDLKRTWKTPQQPRRGDQAQIRLSLGEAAQAPSLYITWCTSWPSNSSSVEVWRADEPEENARTFRGRALDSIKVGGFYVHRVHISNLETNVPLYYSVVNQDAKSPAKPFRVYEPNQLSLPMAIFGDLGVSNGVSREPLIADAREDKFKLAVHAGDMAYMLHRLGDTFLKGVEPITSKVPYHVIPGNHDSLKHIRDRFTMPHNENGRTGNQWHSFDFGGIHVTMISTEVYHTGKQNDVLGQYRWMEADLQKASIPENRKKIPFVVVVGHRPIYCSYVRKVHSVLLHELVSSIEQPPQSAHRGTKSANIGRIPFVTENMALNNC
eukprot:gb/GECG01012905.1/.p1 GENE.gb/GECG01012905.1/~~gb/GECG01012905.1/.p1  ORF type:complete len:433 (+),score=36.18 gb/GECG01012905.1/:1-1299(+)